MYQATDSIHFTDEKGVDIFIPKGKVFPDNHPYVKRLPKHMERLSEDAPPRATRRI